MPSRRLSAPSNLVPVQEIAVNAYSAFNSDNVNMLTRVVSGEKNKDFVVRGLDVKGVNLVDAEVLDPAGPVLNESFPNQASFDDNWVNTGFSWDVTSTSALGEILTGSAATITLQSVLSPVYGDIGYWFKIEFTLVNKPKQLYIQYGSESKTYDHPESGTYTYYVQLYNNNNTFEPIKFSIALDSRDSAYSDDTIYLHNIVITKVLNMGSMIEPIAIPALENPDRSNGLSLDPNNIPNNILHPHNQVSIYPGVAIKDEAVVTMLGTNPTDAATPILTLTYNDPDSWISGVPFGAADFPVDTDSTYYYEDGVGSVTGFDASGNLLVDLWDDAQQDTPPPTYYRKISGQSVGGSNPAYVKWGYIVLYYSFFKNPDPNKAAIGLATYEEISDPRYGEDFMILAKLRFVDKNTVDAIIYYPERQDAAFMDAVNVTYLHLNQLKNWETKPVNVSTALDILAARRIPIGSIVMYAGRMPTDLTAEVETGGWLLCLGQRYLLADYPQYTELAYRLATHQTFFNEDESITTGIGGKLNYTVSGGVITATVSVNSGGVGFSPGAHVVTVPNGNGDGILNYGVSSDGIITTASRNAAGTGYTDGTYTINVPLDSMFRVPDLSDRFVIGYDPTNAVRNSATVTATAHSHLSGTGVSAIHMDNVGAGYTGSVGVLITSANLVGSGAIAHAVLSGGTITSVVVDDPGTGYTLAPIISFYGAGIQQSDPSFYQPDKIGKWGGGNATVLQPGNIPEHNHDVTGQPDPLYGTGGVLTYTVSGGILINPITISNPGSGYTPGSYTINVPNGIGGILNYTIGGGGTITAASVNTAGTNYFDGVHTLDVATNFLPNGTTETESQVHQHNYVDTYYTYSTAVKNVSQYTAGIDVVDSVPGTLHTNTLTTGNENATHTHVVRLDYDSIVIENFGGNEAFDSRPKFITLGFMIKT